MARLDKIKAPEPRCGYPAEQSSAGHLKSFLGLYLIGFVKRGSNRPFNGCFESKKDPEIAQINLLAYRMTRLDGVAENNYIRSASRLIFNAPGS